MRIVCSTAGELEHENSSQYSRLRPSMLSGVACQSCRHFASAHAAGGNLCRCPDALPICTTGNDAQERALEAHFGLSCKKGSRPPGAASYAASVLTCSADFVSGVWSGACTAAGARDFQARGRLHRSCRPAGEGKFAHCDGGQRSGGGAGRRFAIEMPSASVADHTDHSRG